MNKYGGIQVFSLKKRGFTLLELLIVMVLIGLLAGLVAPRMFGKVDTAKVQTAQTQIKLLENAVSIMALEIGGLPPASAGLNWLTQKPEADPQRGLWKGPYLEGQMPKDPWGNAYVYKYPGINGREFSVISYGADGQPGGEGLAADVATK